MHCPNCGTQANNDANFCHICGQALGVDAVSAVSQNREPLKGNNVGGNYTDIEQIDNSKNVAVGEGNTVTSTVVQPQRRAGREISILWGLFKYATFATAFLLVGGVVYFAAISNFQNTTAGITETETSIPLIESPTSTATQVQTPTPIATQAPTTTITATQVPTATLTLTPTQTPTQPPVQSPPGAGDSAGVGNGAAGESTQQIKTLSTLQAETSLNQSEATRSAASTATRTIELTQLAAGTATRSVESTATQSAAIAATRAAVWTATQSAAATNTAGQRETAEAAWTRAAIETQVVETAQAQAQQTQEAQADRTRAAQPTTPPTPTWTPIP